MPGADAGLLNALGQVATSVGLSATLILFFTWQAWKREERLIARLENLEDFSRGALIELTEKTTAAILKDADATTACVRAIESNTNIINDLKSKIEGIRE